MADTYPFTNMAASGVHAKALGLAEDHLRKDSKILIAGSGEGGLEYQLLERERIPVQSLPWILIRTNTELMILNVSIAT